MVMPLHLSPNDPEWMGERKEKSAGKEMFKAITSVLRDAVDKNERASQTEYTSIIHNIQL